MSAISEFVREHAWDTCTVCGNDYGVKRNGWLHVHGPLIKRCPGGNRDGARVLKLRVSSKA